MLIFRSSSHNQAAAQQRKFFSRALTIFSACLLTAATAPTVHAATRTLKKGEKVSVLGNKCVLAISQDGLRNLRIACSGSTTNRAKSGKNKIALKSGKNAIIKAKKCFLVKTSVSEQKINVKCVKTEPTATPTATPTQTSTPTATATSTPTPNANALFGDNTLRAFNTGNPAGIESSAAVTGLNAGDVLVGIDRRPQNGFLYGLGFNSTAGTVQLYAISSITGGATPIGSTGTFVDSIGGNVTIGSGSGTTFGFDFNPLADRIRVVTEGGQNFRMNPNTGAFVDGDLGGSSGSVTGLNMDGAINGTVTSLQEVAYTNNQANTAVTTLYTLNETNDQLCIQTPPNAGTQASCATLSPTVGIILGFDIVSGVNAASSNAAVASGSGFVVHTAAGGTAELLSTVDLTNGAITTGSALGSGGIVGIAVQSPPSIPMIGLAGSNLIRFASGSLGTTTTVAVTGLTSGETLVGIDFRPSTGELFGLGIDPAANTGTLYRIDPQTAAATAIGAASGIAFVNSSAVAIDFPLTTAGYGFDFNPNADRIRVVTGTGLNFRINPITGAPVDGDTGSMGTQPDTALNGATTSADGASYTNSSGIPTVTTLYTIDAATNSLYIQSVPNGGVESGAVAITLNGTALDFSATNGFEIPANVSTATSNTAVTSGSAFAILVVNATSRLYSINLVTGAATDLGAVGSGSDSFTGLAVGQATIR